MKKPFFFGAVVVCVAVACALPAFAVGGADSPELPSLGQLFINLANETGVSRFFSLEGSWIAGPGRFLMVAVGLALLYLGIKKQFEPLLLVTIGFGCILSNIPIAGISEPGGILNYVYNAGIKTGIFPLIIFMGVGALTDFGPLLANPKTILLGVAAQFGIFTTLIGALALTQLVDGINFSFQDAASIGIIGGADGPTAIYVSSQLSPRLLGAISVAAYSYMALVPLIQPPIMRALTTKEERMIRMKQLRPVGKTEKILFPLISVLLCALFLPSAAPLIGFFMFRQSDEGVRRC